MSLAGRSGRTTLVEGERRRRRRRRVGNSDKIKGKIMFFVSI